MKDIKYKWKDGPGKSVDIAKGVQLPQFKVRGHREKERVQELTTGESLAGPKATATLAKNSFIKGLNQNLQMEVEW